MTLSTNSLITQLRSEDTQVRAAAVAALGQQGEAAVTTLLEVLGDSSPRVRWYAASLLVPVATPVAVPGLIGALSDPMPNVRVAAISALARIGTREAIAGISQGLDDPHWQVRRAAVYALGELRASPTGPRLVQALSDPEHAVAREAAAALGKIGSRQTVPGLIQAVYDPRISVRVAAIDDKAAIPAITAATLHGDPDTVTAAREALARLQGKAPIPSPLAAPRPILHMPTLPRIPRLKRRKSGRPRSNTVIDAVVGLVMIGLIMLCVALAFGITWDGGGGGRSASVQLQPIATTVSEERYQEQVIATEGGSFVAVAFSPDGSAVLAVRQDRAILHRNARTGMLDKQVLIAMDSSFSVDAAAFSPDGAHLVARSTAPGAPVYVVNASDGSVQQRLDIPNLKAEVLLWAPLSQTLMVAQDGGQGGELVAWSMSARDIAYRVTTVAEISSIALSPDLQMLAIGFANGKIELRRPGIRGAIQRFLIDEPGSAQVLAFSADGTRLAAGGSDGTIRIWDTAGGAKWPAGGSDGTNRVWDTISGELIYTLEQGSAAISDLAWSPDGRLASGSVDGSVQVWDNRRLVRSYAHDAPVTSLAWSPQGKGLLSADQQGVLMLRTP